MSERMILCVSWVLSLIRELHEIVLSNAGDVEDVHVFTGFGPIQDICFTLINRIML